MKLPLHQGQGRVRNSLILFYVSIDLVVVETQQIKFGMSLKMASAALAYRAMT
jgi:hypothetical protein